MTEMCEDSVGGDIIFFLEKKWNTCDCSINMNNIFRLCRSQGQCNFTFVSNKGDAALRH